MPVVVVVFPSTIAAQRASISKPTFIKVERTIPVCRSEAVPRFFFVLGIADRLSDMLILKVTPWASDLKKRIFRNASVQRGTEEA
jgi:hypothetical protein